MTSFHLPRFYPILDTAALGRLNLDPIEVCRVLLGSGARIVQFRHKGEWSREAFALAEHVAGLARDANATFIVNDRADAALVVGAAGVHLGQTDLRPSAVRTFAGDRLLIGWSTHNEAQLREAASEPADYVALGPIFGTRSKERPDPMVGVAELRRLRGLTDRPLVAIGAITRDNAEAVWSAGADSCAVIADMLRNDWRLSIQQWVELAQREGGT